jgi:hypothetical protein
MIFLPSRLHVNHSGANGATTRGVVVTVDGREFERDDPGLGSPEDVRWLLVTHNWQVNHPDIDVLRIHVRLFAKQLGGRRQ